MDNGYAASGRVFLSVHRHRKPWPKAVSPLRPRFPGYQSSISWKEIGRWSRSTLASWLCWQIENRRGLGGELVLPVVDHTDQQVRTRPSSHDITLPDRRWFQHQAVAKAAASWVPLRSFLEGWNAAPAIVGLISTSNPDLRQLVA